jgi:hypothetical protein
MTASDAIRVSWGIQLEPDSSEKSQLVVTQLS